MKTEKKIKAYKERIAAIKTENEALENSAKFMENSKENDGLDPILEIMIFDNRQKINANRDKISEYENRIERVSA